MDCHVLPGRASAWAFSKVIVLKTALWKAETPCRTCEDGPVKTPCRTDAAVVDDDAEGKSEGDSEGALEGLDLT